MTHLGFDVVEEYAKCAAALEAAEKERDEAWEARDQERDDTMKVWSALEVEVATRKAAEARVAELDEVARHVLDTYYDAGGDMTGALAEALDALDLVLAVSSDTSKETE